MALKRRSLSANNRVRLRIPNLVIVSLSSLFWYSLSPGSGLCQAVYFKDGRMDGWMKVSSKPTAAHVLHKWDVLIMLS
jgi:hypothetical protein